MRILVLTAVTASIIACAACGGKTQFNDQMGDAAVELPAGSTEFLPTPPLNPPLPVQPRGTSESALVVDNTFVFADSGGASGPGGGDSFDIVPTATAVGWAVYRVPLASDARPHTWNLNLTGNFTGGPLRWWVAAYSFSDLRWQYLGELPGLPARPRAYEQNDGGPVQVYLNDALLRSRFISADNGGVEAYFAILVEPASQGGGASLNVAPSTLESFQLGDAGFTPVEPLPAQITGISADVAQSTLTLDITSGGDADFLFLQRRERVSGTSSLKAPSAVNPWEDLGSVPGFVTQFIDPDMAIPSAPPPVADTPYEYRVQSFNLDGSTQLYAQPSAPQIVTLAANQPPVARVFYPGSADISETVTFDASPSTDSDGTITDYEWDFDGDGTFNETDNGEDAAQGQPTVSTSFPTGALVYPVVRVTDDGGSTDAATGSAALSVHGWVLTPVDANSWAPCLLEVAGKPAIAYIQTISNVHTLKYALAPNSTGTGPNPWTTITLSDLGDNNSFNYNPEPSLAIISGNPAVAVQGPDRLSVQYIRSGTADGAGSWASPVTLDPVTLGAGGQGASLAEVNGNPAVAYFHINQDELRYARSSTPTGNSPGDWQAVVIDTGHGEIKPTLRTVGGNPALAYWFTSGEIGQYGFAYHRSDTPTGSSPGDWQKVVVDQPAGGQLFGPTRVGFSVVAGHPALCYRVPQNGRFRYVRSSTPLGLNPADWGTLLEFTDPETPDSNHQVEGLVLLGNQPVFGWIAWDLQSIRLMQSSTTTGAAAGDWALTDVPLPAQGYDTQGMAVINGKLGLAFGMNGASNEALIYATLL